MFVDLYFYYTRLNYNDIILLTKNKSSSNRKIKTSKFLLNYKSDFNIENMEFKNSTIKFILSQNLLYNFSNSFEEIYDNVFFSDKELEISINRTLHDLNLDENINNLTESDANTLPEDLDLILNPKDIYHMALVKNLDLLSYNNKSFTNSIASSVRSMEAHIEFNFPLFVSM